VQNENGGVVDEAAETCFDGPWIHPQATGETLLSGGCEACFLDPRSQELGPFAPLHRRKPIQDRPVSSPKTRQTCVQYGSAGKCVDRSRPSEHDPVSRKECNGMAKRELGHTGVARRELRGRQAIDSSRYAARERVKLDLLVLGQGVRRRGEQLEAHGHHVRGPPWSWGEELVTTGQAGSGGAGEVDGDPLSCFDAGSLHPVDVESSHPSPGLTRQNEDLGADLEGAPK